MEAAERVLTGRELNRAVLARQLLLERAELPLPRALEQIAGIQAQYAPSMYVGLWSRVAALERADVTRALEDRRVVQATLMRLTIHLVSREDFWPMALGTAAARRRLWLRTHPDVTAEQMAAIAARIREAAAGGTLHRRDMDELGGRPHGLGAGQWVDVVRVPPSGTWERRRADLFALADEWLGPPGDTTAEAGVELLVRRYLTGFGPARPAEIADWAGLAARDVTAALARLEVRRFAGEDGRELVDLPGLPLPDPETPAPVRMLPTWDATLLVHCRRAQILPEEHRPRIFSVRTPQSVPTFLVDGAVAGTWRYADGKVAIEPFARLDRATRRALDEEAERLRAFHAP
jgi:hypothetical protein